MGGQITIISTSSMFYVQFLANPFSYQRVKIIKSAGLFGKLTGSLTNWEKKKRDNSVNKRRKKETTSENAQY